MDAIDPAAAGREGRVAAAVTVTADVLAADEGFGADRYDGGRVQRHRQQLEAVAADDAGGGGPLQDPMWTAAGGQPQHSDAAVLQPHTACFETGNNRQLHDLTVSSVLQYTHARVYTSGLSEGHCSPSEFYRFRF